MQSIDSFLDRMPSASYNCYSFAREVWVELCGQDISVPLAIIEGQTKVLLSNAKQALGNFKRIRQPETPCIAIMVRPHFTPHIGIYIDGRILHLVLSGVEFELADTARRFYNTVRYYK